MALGDHIMLHIAGEVPAYQICQRWLKTRKGTNILVTN